MTQVFICDTSVYSPELTVFMAGTITVVCSTCTVHVGEMYGAVLYLSFLFLLRKTFTHG